MMHIRPLVADDQPLLWDLLHVSLWDPPPATMRPRSVLELPHVRIYAEGWGKKTDVGVLGVSPSTDEAMGAAWMRLMPEGIGLASIDDETPQLGIALLPRFQHQGHGRRLLDAALDAARTHGYPRVSLTVHPRNPAIRLYERCGFVRQGLRSSYHLMVATL
jgi:ribosomal protein S18 acetylase RimI-like enzyme